MLQLEELINNVKVKYLAHLFSIITYILRSTPTFLISNKVDHFALSVKNQNPNYYFTYKH